MKLLLLSLFLFTSAAFADLKPEQYAIIKADMQSNPDVAAMLSAEDDIGLANYYSGDSTSQGWNTAFSLRDLFDVIDWQEVISRSVAERTALELMFSLGQVDAGQVNVRQGLADIFSGSQARSVNQRSALIAAAQRTITRIEKLLNIGISGGIYRLGYEGQMSTRDAALARFYQP